jgi:lipopolysaccharide export system permease protein
MTRRTLNLYLTRKFAVWLTITSLAFLALAILGDYLEMVKLAGRFGQSNLDALYYTSLRLPLVFLDFAAFIFLFGTVFCLIRLSQAQELVVIRSAGVSVWQFLTPFLLTAFLIGSLLVAIIEPLGTSSFKAFRAIEDELAGRKVEVQLSKSGVWLREATPNGSFILRGGEVGDLENQRLRQITVLMFDAEGVFTHRLKAKTANLKAGAWQLKNVEILVTGQAVEKRKSMRLTSQLDTNTLAQKFYPPKTINIWQLGGYIETAQAAGSDTTRHEVRFHSLLTLPFMLAAMVLLAACFSLPTGRIISASATMGLAVLSGFGLYIGADFVARLGELQVLPPIIASWTPSLIAGLLAVSYLLKAEDG